MKVVFSVVMVIALVAGAVFIADMAGIPGAGDFVKSVKSAFAGTQAVVKSVVEVVSPVVGKAGDAIGQAVNSI
jgi:hypothetical protein